MKKIEIKLEDAKEIFELLEMLNDIFHQPDRYEDPQEIQKFADANYAKIHKLYYETVWSWLPLETQKEYENR